MQFSSAKWTSRLRPMASFSILSACMRSPDSIVAAHVWMDASVRGKHIEHVSIPRPRSHSRVFPFLLPSHSSFSSILHVRRRLSITLFHFVASFFVRLFITFYYYLLVCLLAFHLKWIYPCVCILLVGALRRTASRADVCASACELRPDSMRIMSNWNISIYMLFSRLFTQDEIGPTINATCLEPSLGANGSTMHVLELDLMQNMHRECVVHHCYYYYREKWPDLWFRESSTK